MKSSATLRALPVRQAWQFPANSSENAASKGLEQPPTLSKTSKNQSKRAKNGQWLDSSLPDERASRFSRSRGGLLTQHRQTQQGEQPKGKTTDGGKLPPQAHRASATEGAAEGIGDAQRLQPFT